MPISRQPNPVVDDFMQHMHHMERMSSYEPQRPLPLLQSAASNDGSIDQPSVQSERPNLAKELRQIDDEMIMIRQENNMLVEERKKLAQLKKLRRENLKLRSGVQQLKASIVSLDMPRR